MFCFISHHRKYDKNLINFIFDNFFFKTEFYEERYKNFILNNIYPIVINLSFEDLNYCKKDFLLKINKFRPKNSKFLNFPTENYKIPKGFLNFPTENYKIPKGFLNFPTENYKIPKGFLKYYNLIEIVYFFYLIELL